MPENTDAGRARPDAGATAGLYLHAASRCGDCHDKMLGEWQGSAHARSVSSPAFTATRAAADDPGSCDRCHQPLARHAAPPSVSREGVTCDVCHTARAVAVGAGSAELELEVGQPVKYGPFCELADHYFHRMGCSPLHRKSELCAGCHHLAREATDGGALIPIYTSYQEWRSTRYARRGVQCQDCHMPSVRAPIAEGGAAHDRIGDHRLAVPGGSGLALEATARADGDAIAVVVTVRNRGAGHHLPTDSPDRRLVVRAVAVDAAGGEGTAAEASFGRLLLDGAGRPAPHTSAVRAGEDTRIAAGASATRTLRLPSAPTEGSIRVELAGRALDPAIAAAIGVPAPPDQTILRAELPFSAAHRVRDLARRVRGRP